jgi:predicted nuclease with RNAse H fold/dephospho-CoA kinase
MFLDIETTGLSLYYDEITVVGWSFAGRANTFVRGDDPEQLLDDLAKAKALVTFNGIRFDARFILQEFPSAKVPPTHIDLVYLCRRVGLTGGQKAIEEKLGLSFRDQLKDIDGFAAVLLWHKYLRGDIAALKMLVQYNRADIAAMGAILDHAIRAMDFAPDLFARSVEFKSWSAPENWKQIPTDLEKISRELDAAPTFDEVFFDNVADDLRVVGIDLTGSEARATGWCLLDGHVAETKMLSTNDEILSATIEAKPNIVSIDSPLCLPNGRLTVDDDDPGREEFGIMRQSERELKRRGVNVYPCLLPSMQKLTARGIQLAAALRSAGIPVIESYPGAAQDIMRIPRKGAGVEWLEMGLREFGIEGDFDCTKVTHDELDAITSALVGTFHLVGKSEALSGENETALIIPELNAPERPVVVGISGPIATGKTTVAKSLEPHGFAYTRFSLVIDELLNERGEELSRENRQRLGKDLNETGKQRWLAEQTILRVKGAQKVVVDGLRFPDDHAFFIESFGNNYCHIFVDTSKEVRRARYLARNKGNGFEFAEESDVELAVPTLRKLANSTVLNHSNITDLRALVHKAINEYFGEQKCLFQS